MEAITEQRTAPALDERISEFTRRYRLTDREGDVFTALAKQVVNSTEIGKYLGVSHHTVSNHLKSIFQKTKTGNKAEVLALFVRSLF